MYSKPISRDEPGCIVFLLDRSDSMGLAWGNSGHTLASGATDVLNRLLFEFCVQGTKHGDQVWHYFDIGVFGYGRRPIAGDEGVESAFCGPLLGRELVSLPDLNNFPLTYVDERPGSRGRPVWLNPEWGERTPMCEAIFVAGDIVAKWIQQHPTSYPPIVINITDGLVTDDPFMGASLMEWADRLTGLSTSDGRALLLNIFLTPDTTAAPVLFPSVSDGLAEPGPTLFRISSPLPPQMVHQAQIRDIKIEPGARGLALNMDLEGLSQFLAIGTRRRIVDR